MQPDWNARDFLRQVTSTYPSWLSWKHLDKALAGQGDFDSMASPNAWSSIAGEFTEHLRAQQLTGATAICDHLPGVWLVCAKIDGFQTLVELDLGDGITLRGQTWGSAESLLRLALIQDGIRRLSPSAEAFIHCILTGVRDIRDLGADADSELTREAIEFDPEGFIRCASIAMPNGLSAPAVRYASALATDGNAASHWHALHLLAKVRSARRPIDYLPRLASYKFRHACPLLECVLYGRRRCLDSGQFLAMVGRYHKDTLRTLG